MNKNIFALAAAALVVSTSMTSCIEEYEPSKGYASIDQVSKAPTAYESLVAVLRQLSQVHLSIMALNTMPTTLDTLP